MGWKKLKEGETLSLPLDEQKALMRVDHDLDDQLILDHINQAKSHIEAYTQTLLGVHEVQVVLDARKIGDVFGGALPGSTASLVGWLRLPIGPLKRIVSVQEFYRERWTDVLRNRIKTENGRLGILGGIGSTVEYVCVNALVGVDELTPILKHVWQSLVTLFYTTEVPAQSRIQDLLSPLHSLKSISLI
jgi:hypothetical protein